MEEVEVKKQCRVCLELSEVMIDLFGDPRTSYKLELCCGVTILNFPTLPSTICKKCVDVLNVAYDFRVLCQNSQEYLNENNIFSEDNKDELISEKSYIPDLKLKNQTEYIDERKENYTQEKEHLGDYESVPVQQIEEDSTVKKQIDVKQKQETKCQLLLKSEDEEDIMLVQPVSEDSENDHDPEFILPTSDNENDDEQIISKSCSTKRKKSGNNSNKNVRKKPLKGRTLMNRKQKERAPIICDICGNVFKAKHIFALHKRRHSNNKPYVCELCPSNFYTNSELKRHMRRHTGEKPYECQYCHRKFSDYGTHVKHERTHTNDRPFDCKHCGKAFSCGFVLKNHMLTHTGERAFKCTVCDKSFGRLHNLTTHEKSIYHQNNLLKKENGEKIE